MRRKTLPEPIKQVHHRRLVPAPAAPGQQAALEPLLSGGI